MVWTLVVFLISLFILRKWVFPLIGEALDKRAERIEGEIDAAEQLREEADKVLGRIPRAPEGGQAQAEGIEQRAARRPKRTSRRPASK